MRYSHSASLTISKILVPINGIKTINESNLEFISQLNLRKLTKTLDKPRLKLLGKRATALVTSQTNPDI